MLHVAVFEPFRKQYLEVWGSECDVFLPDDPLPEDCQLAYLQARPKKNWNTPADPPMSFVSALEGLEPVTSARAWP